MIERCRLPGTEGNSLQRSGPLWSPLDLARVARAQGRYGIAASLLGAASVRLNVTIDLHPAELEIAVTRTYLGQETYAKAQEKGRRTPTHMIVDLLAC